MDRESGANAVLFRCDASADVGFGHVTRSLALAQAFAAVGVRPVFLMSPTDRASTDRVESLGFSRVTVADERSELPVLEAAYREHGARFLVADSYRPLAAYLDAATMGGALFRVVIDDLADRVLPCEAVVNHGLAARSLDYSAWSAPTRLLGPEYALVRAEYLRAERPTSLGMPLVVLTLGGTEPDRLADLFDEMDALAASFAIAVVVPRPGPCAQWLTERAVRARHPTEVQVGPTSLAPLLARATVAVSGGGTTTFELAAMRVPSLVVLLAENQRPSAQAWDKLGAAKLVGELSSLAVGTLARALDALLADGARQAAMAESAHRIVDGKGAARVVQALLDAERARGSATAGGKRDGGPPAPGKPQACSSPFRFRRLGEADLEMVMRWRVKPEVTRFMRSDPVFDMEAQRRWFASVDRNPRCQYWIVEMQGRPVGTLNLAEIDRTNRRASWGYYLGETDCWHVGGLVLPHFYNYVFDRKDLQLRKLTAEILGENTNVLRMHAMHGYRVVGTFRDHILKNGVFHDVVQLELLREDWAAQQDRYGHLVAPFDE